MKTGWLILLSPLLFYGCSSQEVSIRLAAPDSLSGEFRYMADAPLITLCKTGRRYPVAMEGPYVELERAYLASGVEAGEPVWVSVKGGLEQRPGGGGDGKEEVFVVQSYEAMDADRRCPAKRAPLLEGQVWQLIEMPGNALRLPHDHMPYLLFDDKEKRITGFGACNRFFGGYKRMGDRLEIGPLASTRMSCGDLDLIEQAFFQRLEQVDRWQIRDRQLRLLKGNEALLFFQTR